MDDIPRNFLLLSCFNLLSPWYSSREGACVQPVECSSHVDCIPAACGKSPVAGGEDVVVTADVLAVTTRLVETVNVLQKDTLNTRTGKGLRITRPGKRGGGQILSLPAISASIRARITKLGKRKDMP